MSCGCSDCEYIRELEAEVEALDHAHRHVLNQRNDAQDLLESNKRIAEQKLAAANARIEKAITWLVTVKANQPASIIADRARLALEALRAHLAGHPTAPDTRTVRVSPAGMATPQQFTMNVQPAAPSRTEAEQECCMGGKRTERWCGTVRSEAEQAVLDAMASVSEHALRVEATEVEWETDDLAKPARAELARRGLK